MKFYIYRTNLTNPIVITTDDKSISKLEKKIGDAILKNQTLVLSNKHETVIVKLDNIDCIKIGDDIQLTNDNIGKDNDDKLKDLEFVVNIDKKKTKKSKQKIEEKIEDKLEEPNNDISVVIN